MHGQLESYSSFIWFAHPIRSHLRRRIYAASCTWSDKQGKICRQQENRKHTIEHTAYEIATWQKVTDYSSSAGVKLFDLLD